MTKPAELEEAEIVETLAQRYHTLPDVIRRQDAGLLRHVAILNLAQPAPAEG